MIKAEVVFDGDNISCNGINLEFEMFAHGDFWIADGYSFKNLEQAIAYCLEQSHDPKTTD